MALICEGIVIPDEADDTGEWRAIFDDAVLYFNPKTRTTRGEWCDPTDDGEDCCAQAGIKAWGR
jgi:hypothetical protein